MHNITSLAKINTPTWTIDEKAFLIPIILTCDYLWLVELCESVFSLFFILSGSIMHSSCSQNIFNAVDNYDNKIQLILYISKSQLYCIDRYSCDVS